MTSKITYTYDAMGNLTAINTDSDIDGRSVSKNVYAYESKGNILSITAYSSYTTSYQDEINRKPDYAYNYTYTYNANGIITFQSFDAVGDSVVNPMK